MQKKNTHVALNTPLIAQLRIRVQLNRTLCMPSWYRAGNCNSWHYLFSAFQFDPCHNVVNTRPAWYYPRLCFPIQEKTENLFDKLFLKTVFNKILKINQIQHTRERRPWFFDKCFPKKREKKFSIPSFWLLLFKMQNKRATNLEITLRQNCEDTSWSNTPRAITGRDVKKTL